MRANGSPQGTADPAVLGYLLLAVPLVLLGILGRAGVAAGLLVAAGGLGAAIALLRLRRSLRPYSPVPAAAVAIGLAAVAPPTTLTELFAGAAGLALLLATGLSVAEPRPIGALVPSVGLPALALALALGSSIALPSGSADVGVAAALLAAVLLLLAYLFSRQEGRRGASAPPS